MQDELDFPLTSEIHFDRYSSNLSVDFSNRDYEAFKDTLFASGSIDFRVKAIVHGSDVEGPAADNHVTADFSIKFIDAAAFDQCKENDLHLLDTKVDGSQRTAIAPYTIVNYGETTVPITIEARKVKATIPECATNLNRFVEIWHEACEWDDTTQSMKGCWMEFREEEGLSTFDLEATQPSIEWSANQKWFLDEGRWLSHDHTSEEDYNPDFITVKMRFVTKDSTSGAEAVDVVEWEVHSSREDYSDFCNWDDLSINEPVSSDTRTYKVADAKEKDIQIWSTLEGKESLDQGCEDQLYMALEIVRPSGKTE
jgi:hypothetical protein